MPEQQFPLRDFIIDTTWKILSSLSRLGSNFISRSFTHLVDSAFTAAADLVREKGHKISADMASMIPISISSSESDSIDWDLDNYRDIDPSIFTDTASSSGSRVLPGWPSSSTSVAGSVRSTQIANSRNVASSLNGNSLAYKNNNDDDLQMLSSSNGTHRSSNLQFARGEKSKNFSRNEFEDQSSRTAVKRMLPSSLQTVVSPSVKLGISVNEVGSSQIRENSGKPNYSARTNPNHTKNYMKDPSFRGADEEIVKNGKHPTRILPPSMIHPVSVPIGPYAGLNDPLHRPGLFGEKVADERLIYQAALQDINQPKLEVNLPDGLLSVSLLRHQKIALAWMLQKEGSVHCLGGILADDQGLGKTISMIALIQMQKLRLKPKLDDSFLAEAEALNLDDDDDKGASGAHEIKKTTESDDLKLIPQVSSSRKPAAGSLVVCPATVLRQWAQELDEKVADEAKLKILVYHGGNRTKNPVELATYDVVLTTYAIVKNEVPQQPLDEEEDDDQRNGERHGLSSEFSTNKKRKVFNADTKRKKGRKGFDNSVLDCDFGTLAKVSWQRVILDEAQTIKNHRTKVARSCSSLRAKRRWCLSGTPIQNSVDELFSYFRFLRYDPYASYKYFCSQIKFPISKDSIQGYKKLQAVLRAVMLRRTKGTFLDGQPIINLPPKTINLRSVDFSPEERVFYSKLEAESRSQFKAYAAAGTVNQNYANILLMLLRLRQACDHPLLVKGFNPDSVSRVPAKMMKKLPKDMLIKLLSLLDTSLSICCMCNDPPEDAVVTICGHVFCYQCVSEYLTGDDNTCPSLGCRRQIGEDVVFSEATLKGCLSDDADHSSTSKNPGKSVVLQNNYSSSKIRAALDIIQSHCRPKGSNSGLNNIIRCNGNSSFPDWDCSGSGASSDPETSSDLGAAEVPIKAIVFSQWTGMLDLVEMSLNQHCIEYRRLDGTMSLASRDRAVKEFNTDPEVTVMLMSLKAGNLGLNMVAASHVILLDLWWNPTTEDQAVDRAHRIGQTRPVTVSRLTIKGTVEDRILSLQEEKRKMVASAFGEDPSGGTTTRLTAEDLKYLFMGV